MLRSPDVLPTRCDWEPNVSDRWDARHQVTSGTMTSVKSHPLVTIAMLTFRRNDEVSEALPMLLEQAREVEVRSEGRVHVNILVVDNDPHRHAESTVRTFDYPALRYVCEPSPGISAARNRALDEAAESDILVFIDDDERPGDSWLWSLLKTKRDTGAAAVAGPVVSRFDGPPDPWIVAGEFFDRTHRSGLRTGETIERAATNNLLLDMREIRRLELRFDLRFGLTGGEDSLFTGQLARSGARLVWCAEAYVDDVVPLSRMTRRYALRRTFSLSNSSVKVEIELATSAINSGVTRLRAAVIGSARILLGIARMGLGMMTRSLPDRALGQRLAYRGLGAVGASLGYSFLEYGRSKN